MSKKMDVEKEFAEFRRKLSQMTPQEYDSPETQAELLRLKKLRATDTGKNTDSTVEKQDAEGVGGTVQIFRPEPAVVVPGADKQSINRRKQKLAYAAVAVIVFGFGVASFNIISSRSSNKSNNEIASTSFDKNQISQSSDSNVAKVREDRKDLPSLEEVTADDPEYRLNPEKVSAVFKDFFGWGDKSKLDYVSDVMNVQVLPFDVLALFKREIQNKENSHLLRNNMANALMAQSKHIYELEPIFLRMFEDTSESPTWRDYSLQFYAQCASFSPAPSKIQHNLLTISTKENPDPNSATAAMMLTYEAGQKELELPADFNEKLAATMLNSPERNLQAAAISIFTRVRAVDKLPIMREKINNADPLIRRVSIAGIGELGGKDDLGVVRSMTRDPDPLVAMAAKAAVKKLQAKTVDGQGNK